MDVFEAAEKIMENALVSALSVASPKGQVSTHPMLPLYSRERKKLYFTSSILFSRKVEHIKTNPKVGVLFSGRQFINTPSYAAVHVKGDAKIYEENLNNGWMWLLDLWTRKEPYIGAYIKQRLALPLFWERIIIEVTPREILLWDDGDVSKQPRRWVR
ncbi:MAG: pyridoxamine 5'-phosphate oxidase family protein [Candidatus Caldarchaeum sp.]|nr:pyridoxamine 5'-phosphate oxidase family protein [Candidatus Caldarchaeum sp.]MCS7137522.1 pyridoxamine 5'-phosphate oxidase family protein [Candidatus Caldarchaeum sp.]MDW7977328.1 pyridoxamine 5'-phosphate oxidase family protein [Candidatus Caldarchaeum sp.]MDW8359718.1 pyridoxamine 5'-phosphate oxidase family protein [Candidatus Caldarchaeum sp.]